MTIRKNKKIKVSNTCLATEIQLNKKRNKLKDKRIKYRIHFPYDRQQKTKLEQANRAGLYNY